MPKDIAFILYNTPEHSEKVQVVIREETLWMTQKAMAELFGVDKSSISRHLKNIFEAGELDETVVVAKIETTTQHGAIEGKMQTTESNFYNLDAIISVGYRVNSVQAEATSEKISVVQTEGSRQVNRATLFYNLKPPHLVVGDAALVGNFSSILHRYVHLVDDLLGLGGT